ncbi:MAG: GxxExxY protein [Planctomycetia bacterium]|nr:GxxExxY protein [Planctomycetia bacterium]
MTENEIGKIIVDCAYHIHTDLGPGLLESVYETVLVHELRERGLRVRRQVGIPIVYKGITFEEGFRADLIVEDKVIIEIKSVERKHEVYYKQLLTYLRLSGTKLGYLINFGEKYIKTGIERVVNQLPE